VTSAAATVAASPPAPDVVAAPRLSWRATVVAAVVVTLVRPATWVVALAGFLAGGGIVALAWPILVLPTMSGLQNFLGAPVSTLAFGNPSAGLIEFVSVAVIGGVVALVAGLLVGAWAERRGIGLVLAGAAEEGYTAAAPDLRGGPGPVRIALLRVTALVPPVVVAALAWPTLYNVTYKELILPEDLATPLPVRVIAQVPLLLAALVGAWILADAAAAGGVRHLVVGRRSLARAFALGWLDLLRRPHRLLPIAVLGTLALVLTAGPALVVASLAWLRVREALELGGSPIGIVIAALWVAIWLGSVVLAGVGAATRSALYTMENARRR
jgi:hypothetical protein